MTTTSEAAQTAIAITTQQRSEIDTLFAQIALMGVAFRKLERDNETLQGRVEALEMKLAGLEGRTLTNSDRLQAGRIQTIEEES